MPQVRDWLWLCVGEQGPGAELPSAGLSAGEYAAARDRVIAGRASAAALIAALARDQAGIIEAAESTATDDEHDPEGPTIAFERERTAALLGHAHRRLADLDGAAARLSDGSYGICELCRGQIGGARLAARPAASCCISCAARQESRRP